ncbi:hypothetical protein Sste5344_000697 [Sporothrix stenoceras]
MAMARPGEVDPEKARAVVPTVVVEGQPAGEALEEEDTKDTKDMEEEVGGARLEAAAPAVALAVVAEDGLAERVVVARAGENGGGLVGKGEGVEKVVEDAPGEAGDTPAGVAAVEAILAEQEYAGRNGIMGRANKVAFQGGSRGGGGGRGNSGGGGRPGKEGRERATGVEEEVAVAEVAAVGEGAAAADMITEDGNYVVGWWTSRFTRVGLPESADHAPDAETPAIVQRAPVAVAASTSTIYETTFTVTTPEAQTVCNPDDAETVIYEGEEATETQVETIALNTLATVWVG